ncbi:hypothetical protein L6452_19950 [Arctium lappa]|uniref:Uncharacterized protein n=1 Tax=Arctium lappa TaxID=4217 RepID=A0ACB9BA25_ARCLA|nr:hypothetical protein L6452_19950 [Arctium lappa]
MCGRKIDRPCKRALASPPTFPEEEIFFKPICLLCLFPQYTHPPTSLRFLNPIFPSFYIHHRFPQFNPTP